VGEKRRLIPSFYEHGKEERKTAEPRKLRVKAIDEPETPSLSILIGGQRKKARPLDAGSSPRAGPWERKGQKRAYHCITKVERAQGREFPKKTKHRGHPGTTESERIERAARGVQSSVSQKRAKRNAENSL